MKHFFLVAVLSVAWFFLTDGNLSSWLVGAPTIALAVLASSLLPSMPTFHIHPLKVVPFLIFFIYQSTLGGVDVALRAVKPSCPLSPKILSYTYSISNGTAKVFFAHIVSLLPGTLSADFEGETLMIHLLDQRLPNEQLLRKLESKVAAIFGERYIND